MEPTVAPMEGGGKPPVALTEALGNVDSILSLGVHVSCDQPMITSSDTSLAYTVDMDAGFADLGAFKIDSKFHQELTRQAKLTPLLAEAQQYASVLYAWRSCSLGIPMIKSNDQPNRMDIYNTTYDVLKPEIDKLKRFYEFQKRAVELFCAEMKHVCEDRSAFVSDEYLHTLGLFINMFAVLDELKNIKASIKNDHSAFKRASSILKKTTDPREVVQTEQFSMFLGTNNSILSDVKARMKEVAGYEGLMCDIINTCVDKYDHHMYLKATEKHVLVKVIGFCLCIIDSETMNINKLDGRRKLNLNKIDKIFKQTEVVPLFGDMMIGPFKYIEGTPNFDPFKWSHCMSDEPSRQAEMTPKYMAGLRQDYIRLVSELTWQCHVRGKIIDINHKYKRTVPEGESRRDKEDQAHLTMYELALTTLQRLAAWSGRITELFSWKLLHPCEVNENRGNCPKDAESYERATKYNYSSEEKFVLVEMIGMIKSIQELVSKLEVEFQDAVVCHIYAQVQDFVQVQLREPLRKAFKSKKDIIKTTLLTIQAICTDLVKNSDPKQDPLLVKLKKDSETGYKVDTARKRIPPSSTQMYLLRMMLESLVEKKDKNTGRKTPRKDLLSDHITLIETFLSQTRYWTYLLNFNKSVHECADLSQLWYREFYLEMTKGERRQFPIEMSMPWILTDHILESKDAQMMEYVLYTLDLYNDSAHWALHKFHKQYLYDEIEAEVNLCMDLFVFKLGDQIFDHYKRVAGSILLDRTFKSLCQKYGFTIKHPNRLKYDNLMKISSVEILGRSVDLNLMLSQRITEALQKGLNAAITRFEAGPLTGIVELEALISVSRLTHRLLAQYLTLDPFEHLLQEADHHVSSPLGRISQNVFVRLNQDLMPHYCYNGSTFRFVKTVLSFTEEPEYDKPPNVGHVFLWGSKNLTQIANVIYGQYSNFIGPPHFQSMVQLIGYQDIAAIFKEIQKIIQSIIEGSIVPYVKTLTSVMPQRCKMPRYEYTSPGILEYYAEQLKDIMLYGDLQPKVFQVLREMGNAIVFCLHLENALTQKEILEINHAALFQHVIPKPYIKKKGKSKEEVDKDLKAHMKEMENKYKYQNVVPIIKKTGTEEQKEIVDQMAVLTREKLCCGLSIFRKVLEQLREKLADPVWSGELAQNGLFDVTGNREFQRLWSALQFVFCFPMVGQGHTVESLFGEGLNWAGCTLVTLLGQQRRFEAMDYSYHLMRVYRVDQIEKMCRGVSVNKMADRIRKFSILNDQIFSILNKYLSDGKESIAQVQVVHLEPPRYEGAATVEVDKGMRNLAAGARESVA